MLGPILHGGLALTATRGPSFDDAKDARQIQAHDNFLQIPMLFITTMVRPS